MKTTFITAALILAGCTSTPTCFNEHGHHPHGHHPACEVSMGQNDTNGPPAPPPTLPPPDPDPGHLNNGFGNGDQDAPGKSEFHNQAENKGGNN